MKIALDGLDEFSHVFILFVFHENTNVGKDSFSTNLKIVPPRKGKKVGVLSTRSPHRPNPIGLSVCKVEGIDLKQGHLLLSGVDLVDNTPVLDVKPFIQLDNIPLNQLKVPEWVNPDQPTESKPVVWTDSALELLQVASTSKSQSGLYANDTNSLKLCIEESLSQDPRNKFDRGKTRVEDCKSEWFITVYGLRCYFEVTEKEVTIVKA